MIFDDQLQLLNSPLSKVDVQDNLRIKRALLKLEKNGLLMLRDFTLYRKEEIAAILEREKPITRIKLMNEQFHIPGFQIGAIMDQTSYILNIPISV